MRVTLKKGLGFGLTSGVITTLGLMVGLSSNTHSSGVVVGGILVIAIADALSDALGIHISEEAANIHTTKEIWESTLFTFISKLFFSGIFIIPVLLFSLHIALVVSILSGGFLIVTFSYYMAKKQGIEPYKAIFEHVLIAVMVIFITHYVGKWVSVLT